MVGLSQRTVYKLRSRLFSHMQKLPVSFYDKRQHGELMSRMTNDIETISQTLNTSFIQFTTSIVTISASFFERIYRRDGIRAGDRQGLLAGGDGDPQLQ